MSTGCLPVEFDAQAGAGGRQEVAIFPLWLHGHHVGEGGAGLAGLFLDAHVGRGQVELEARRRRDRPQGVVHGQLDVVGLTPAGDLPGLGDAAHDAQVDACVVDPFLLDKLAKFPF
ncbi:hypothetical protein RY27_01310 [Litorilinea aerophila]|nr:hypothetical protein RY27_01310 [Litorilinea aerophila]